MGIGIITMCCFVAGFAAVFLGRCWLIVEERYPEYRSNVRDPFALIGLRAVGPKMSSFVTLNIVLQLFGVAVVFLLIASELIGAVLKHTQYFANVTHCNWIVILGLALLPFMWFGSPVVSETSQSLSTVKNRITFCRTSLRSRLAPCCVLWFLAFWSQFCSSKKL